MTASSLDPHPTEPVESRWRRIVTPIPVPESVPMIRRIRAVEPLSMQDMPPIIWDEAEGFLVRDPYGNQWIDLTSAIVMANAGHDHPRVRAAIHAAADRHLLASYAYPTEVRLALLEKLVALSPVPEVKAILFSAGTEATEAAMMLMRRHGKALHDEKIGIVSLAAGYHGRTVAAVAASGTPGPDDWIAREKLGHYQIPFPHLLTCPWGHAPAEPCGASCFEKSLGALAATGIGPERIAGIISESMPGWATSALPAAYAEAMARWAREHDILICFDEVQAGCGRTGRMFAFEHIGIQPDFFTLGKGLTSSLPVSAVVGRADVMDLPKPGEMSSTHGGNPLCCAVALAALEALEADGLVAASARTGALVLARLHEIEAEFPDRFLTIDGRGLFIAAHLRDPTTGTPDVEFADAIVHRAVRRGVMMFVTGRGMLKFSPPLCIEPDAALEAVEVVRHCLLEALSETG